MKLRIKIKWMNRCKRELIAYIRHGKLAKAFPATWAEKRSSPGFNHLVIGAIKVFEMQVSKLRKRKRIYENRHTNKASGSKLHQQAAGRKAD